MKVYYPSGATKTTFVLSDSRRARLKSLAVARRTTVTELLAEGAELVLEKYEGVADKALLEARARQAREQLRQGFFQGYGVPGVDEVVYGQGHSAKRKTTRSRTRRRKV